MKKTMLALATVATMAVGTLAPRPPPMPAATAAQSVRVWQPALSAAPSSAARSPTASRAIMRQLPGYVVYEGYGAPYPAGCPGGYWARRPLRDAYGNFIGWSKPRFICP